MSTKREDAAGTFDSLLTPEEAAARFKVRVITLTRWAKAGKIGCTRTLGGHRRYYQDEVDALLATPRQDGRVHS